MAKSIHDLINERWGVRSRPIINPLGILTVGTGVSRLVRTNPMRYALMIQNIDDTNTLFLMPNDDPSATLGMQLPPGGIAAWSWEEDFVLPSQEWNASASGANTNVFVMVVEGEPD